MTTPSKNNLLIFEMKHAHAITPIAPANFLVSIISSFYCPKFAVDIPP
jgi:hypothetical protein